MYDHVVLRILTGHTQHFCSDQTCILYRSILVLVYTHTIDDINREGYKNLYLQQQRIAPTQSMSMSISPSGPSRGSHHRPLEHNKIYIYR